MKEYNKLILECSRPGRTAYCLPESDVPEFPLPDGLLREKEPKLPEVSEVDVVRHYTNLSRKNYAVDIGMYPLQPAETVQGALELMARTEKMLCELTGMSAFTLQPAAGAQGEITGLMMIRAYHRHRGDERRRHVIIPDSAHGTNPASASMAGMEVVEVKSDKEGGMDLDALQEALNDEVAGLMLTNPNTLGLFDKNIVKIADMVHKAGGLLYYDGANANAIMGITRPGDMGFDIVHLNLHKTFSTPHGGGGPGSGPVGVADFLKEFLPTPVVAHNGEGYVLEENRPLSIGKVKSWYGNFGVVVRAYCYILSMGAEGLKAASRMAVLNANYMKEMLKDYYELPYDRTCMHEFVLGELKNNPYGITAKQIAKRLMDYGLHPPTTYFPLIVHEALMVEPTETESVESMEEYVQALIRIAQEAAEDPDVVKTAPHTTIIKQLDEVQAARNPVVKW